MIVILSNVLPLEKSGSIKNFKSWQYSICKLIGIEPIEKQIYSYIVKSEEDYTLSVGSTLMNAESVKFLITERRKNGFFLCQTIQKYCCQPFIDDRIILYKK